MNSFLGQINEQDVGAIIWYMKSISDKFDKSGLPTKPPALEAAGSTTAPSK
jgi:hypothetical protein